MQPILGILMTRILCLDTQIHWEEGGKGKDSLDFFFFFLIVRVSFALGLFGDQIQTPVTQSVFGHKISKAQKF